MTDKNCTYCHWYDWKTGGCKHENTFNAEKEDMQALIEEAPIHEAVEEGFTSIPFDKLRMNLEDKLSKKQVKRIMEEFYTELDNIKLNWIDKITENVIYSVVNHCDGDREAVVRITEPKEFYCKHFM